MSSLYYVIAVLLVLVGIAGTILPALPGLPLVFAGMLLAAWAGDFEKIGSAPLVDTGHVDAAVAADRPLGDGNRARSASAPAGWRWRAR